MAFPIIFHKGRFLLFHRSVTTKIWVWNYFVIFSVILISYKSFLYVTTRNTATFECKLYVPAIYTCISQDPDSESTYIIRNSFKIA